MAEIRLRAHNCVTIWSIATAVVVATDLLQIFYFTYVPLDRFDFGFLYVEYNYLFTYTHTLYY